MTHVMHLVKDLAVGGGQKVVLDLATHVDPTRFRVTVAYVGKSDSMRTVFEQAGIRPIGLGYRGRRDALRVLSRLVRLIHVQKVDLLHVHTTLDKQFGELAAFLCGIPVVSHLHMSHDYATDHSDHPVRARIRNVVHAVTVSRFVAVSEQVYKSHLESVPDGRLRLIYNGIAVGDLRAPRPDQVRLARTSLGLDQNAVVLVTVGRLTAQKDQAWMVRVMPHLRDWQSDVHLVVVGDGPERSRLEQIASELGVDDSVHLLGSRLDVPDIVGASDVFVFSSAWESLGLAPLEAMALERPVVAFHLPCLAEFIGDGVTGRLVTDRSTESLAKATIDVLSGDPKQMGRRARAVVEERFDIHRTAQQVGEVYDEVLRGRPSLGSRALRALAR